MHLIFNYTCSIRDEYAQIVVFCRNFSYYFRV